MKQIKKWNVFEQVFEGPKEGNPFLDVELSVTFSCGNKTFTTIGFYDGNGCYKARIMPDKQGEWSYKTESNVSELDVLTGKFTCIKPDDNAHGPMRVKGKFELAYEDGTRYFQIGTTCYVWNHQPKALREQTLDTLSKAPFNKIRMCIFPKDYSFNSNKMETYPFVGTEEDGFDFTRFEPKYWAVLEDSINSLMDLGIEADIIIFHPYDRWGFAKMDATTDDLYLEYMVARLAAYRNVWWSFANEFDLMENKKTEDWDRYFQIVQKLDPHQHLRGNHNCRGFYDHNKSWVTHCSIQSSTMDEIPKWREMYEKPILIDECCYEGNIEFNWGNISAKTMVSRFWDGMVRGAYVGHGETYLNDEEILWWSRGGMLYGQSPDRIAFFKKYFERLPENCEILEKNWSWKPTYGIWDELFISYTGDRCPIRKPYNLPEDKEYTIEIIDTWEMTSNILEGTFSGKGFIPLPGKPYIAYWIEEVK